MFKNWIQVDIIKVGNLKFVNGTIDEKFIYKKIRKKMNIFSELSIIKKALKPFAHFLGSHDPETDISLPLFHHKDEIVNNFTSSKSKYFYEKLIEQKLCKPERDEAYWQQSLSSGEIDFSSVYIKKVGLITDKKIAEFNFKLLHKILPCNSNLFKWKIKDNNICTLCDIEEDIPHLLFHCTYAQSVWKILSDNCDIDITLEDIILSSSLDLEDSFIISSLAYFIFKKWLKCSYDNIPRNLNNVKSAVSAELQYIYNVYSHLKSDQICLRLNSIIQNL